MTEEITLKDRESVAHFTYNCEDVLMSEGAWCGHVFMFEYTDALKCMEGMKSLLKEHNKLLDKSLLKAIEKVEKQIEEAERERNIWEKLKDLNERYRKMFVRALDMIMSWYRDPAMPA